MRENGPQLINYFIKNNDSLQILQRQAIKLVKLEQTLNALLPDPLSTVCRLSNYRNCRLIIQVSSAAWLTRLRYEQAELISALRQAGLPELSGIDFTINPNLNKRATDQNRATTRQRELTYHSSKIITNLAKNCKGGLKRVLMQLAQHTKKNNNDHRI